MTIYDLTQALKRYRRKIFIAFGVLIILVLAMTFTIEDGKPSFRAGERYESEVQIAVVEPGTVSLAQNIESDNRSDAASLYASLLASDEAAVWIGEANDYVPTELVEAELVERGSVVITAKVAAPTREQAAGAALSTFDWLEKKIQEPIETANVSPPTTLPTTYLFQGSVESNVNVTTADGLSGVSDDVFVFVDVEDQVMVLPVQNAAGTTTSMSAALDPRTTVVLSLKTAADDTLDTVRVVPPPAPTTVETVPELAIELLSGAVTTDFDEDGEPTWVFNRSRISIEWTESTTSIRPPSVESTSATFDLALLTPNPGTGAVGGRRGPLVAVTAIIIGAIVILTTVVVVDTWRRERDSHELIDGAPDRTESVPQPRETAYRGIDPTDSISAEIDVNTISIEP